MFKNKNKDLLKSEDELLLLCCRTEIDEVTKHKIESLLHYDLDWEHLIEMADKHRLMPLLYVNLSSIFSKSMSINVLQRLKKKYRENTHKNLLLTSELVKIMKLLEKNNIKAVTYKGPALAHSIYENIGYRQYGDIDILIDKQEAPKAKNLMINNGYELFQPIKIDDSTYMELESEYIFINKENGAKVEINWNFEGKFFHFHGDPQFLFDDLDELEINSIKFHSFSPVNQLLMLSIHAAKHNWNRLQWTCDISHYVQNVEINWTKTIEKAEKLGFKRILMINLLLAQELFGLELPEQINNNQDSAIPKILKKIKNKIFHDKKDSLTLSEKFFLDINKRERLADGIKDCWLGFTQTSYNDFLDLNLPKKLFPLYPVIRPILLIKRYNKTNI